MLPSDEQRISLKAACRHPLLSVDERPLSIAAIYRKAVTGQLGLDGTRHRLETERGARGAMVTSAEAIERFIAAINRRLERSRKQIAIRSVGLAFAIVAIFGAVGPVLLKVFGITLDAFRIAGGLLIAKVGYDLLHRGTSRTHVPPVEAQIGAAESDFSVVVSPLAMPLLAGPGTIVTTITYTAHGTMVAYAIVTCAFAIVCITTMLCFLGAQAMVKRISPSFLNVTGRLMGLILAVVGVQMTIDGLAGAFGIGRSGPA